MMLPAAAARFWAYRAETMCAVAVVIGMVSGVIGLLISYHFSLPSGPAIILVAGIFYLTSVLAGTRGVIPARLRPHRHRVA
jgi:zinc/manganese transport system permease protein